MNANVRLSLVVLFLFSLLLLSVSFAAAQETPVPLDDTPAVVILTPEGLPLDEATPIPAEILPVEGIENPVTDNSVFGLDRDLIWVLAVIVALIAFGVYESVRDRRLDRLVDRYVEALQRKDVRDEAERQYMERSLTVEQWVFLAQNGLRFVGGLNLPVIDKAVDATVDFIDEVTDGQLNVPTASPTQIARRPKPDDTPPGVG